MIKFIILKTNEEKTASSVTESGGFYCVRFSEGGRVYVYKKEHIKIVQGEVDSEGGKSRGAFPFKLYSVPKTCWKCGKDTELLTYMVYSDDIRESLTYPWDKERLIMIGQTMFDRIPDGRAGGIEFYGLYVLGDLFEYDSLIMEKYPRRVKIQYSKKMNSRYPMNVCTHCGAKQGWLYLFQAVNFAIIDMQPLKVLE